MTARPVPVFEAVQFGLASGSLLLQSQSGRAARSALTLALDEEQAPGGARSEAVPLLHL